MKEFHHVSVLLEECIQALNIKPDGIYVDGTLGGAGHSSRIAALLTTGRLIGIDRDPVALEAAGKRLEPWKDRVTLVHSNFCQMDQALDSLGIEKVDGILLDLGVSSPQLDDGERGFSYMVDAPLDMRMSCDGVTAAEIVNETPEKELADLIYKYGEERKSRQIAAKIAAYRKNKEISTTKELAEIIYTVIHKTPNGIDPATRTFQALRIAVNNELGELENGLRGAVDLAVSGGRIVVVSFHSLEDRIVKTFFKENTGKNVHVSRYLPDNNIQQDNSILASCSKAVAPSQNETEVNSRSRSAKLRYAVKR